MKLDFTLLFPFIQPNFDFAQPIYTWSTPNNAIVHHNNFEGWDNPLYSPQDSLEIELVHASFNWFELTRDLLNLFNLISKQHLKTMLLLRLPKSIQANNLVDAIVKRKLEIAHLDVLS